MIIGIYDSGLGGLTVWREIRQLRAAKLIYFGDTLHMPYGEKTPGQLQDYFWKITEFFQSKGTQAVVVACNTSSALVLPEVKTAAPLPVFGVIDAALEAILPVSRGRVGLLATKVTVESGVYQQALQKRKPSWRVFAQSAPRLVPLIEAGKISGPEVEAALREYLEPLLAQEIDTLFLGCTHYPFLKELIEKISGPGLKIVNPAKSLALEVSNWLQKTGAGPKPQEAGTEFWVSADPQNFRKVARDLLREDIPQVGFYQFPGEVKK